MLEKRKCITSDLRLAGSDDGKCIGSFENLWRQLASEIEMIIKENPETGLAVDPRLPYTVAEIDLDLQK